MRRFLRFERFVMLFVALLLSGLDVPGPRSGSGVPWPLGLTGSARADTSDAGANLGLDCKLGPCRVAVGAHRTEAAGVDSNWGSTYVGDRINFATGNVFYAETDYTTAGSVPLVLARYFNSQDANNLDSGTHRHGNWRSSYSRSVTLIIEYGNYVEYDTAYVTRDDGKVLKFTRTASAAGTSPWSPPVYSSYRLEGGGWGNEFRLITDQDETERYDADGRLLSVANRAGAKVTIGYDGDHRISTVSDPFGRTLTFRYDGLSRISEARAPDGNVYTYEYDWYYSRLSAVKFPDQSKRQYHYEHGWYPYSITGETDENGSRYTSYSYDDSTGRAVYTEHAGGTDRYNLAYGDAWGIVWVVPSLGAQKKFTLTTIDNLKRTIEEWRACSGCSPNGNNGQSAANTFDGHANLTSHADFNGNRTTFAYDEGRHLPTSETRAAGTSLARTITTAWHPNFRLPTQIVDGDRTVTNAYDGKGNLQRATVATASTTSTRSFTYDDFGQLLTEKDPRGAQTTYAYDTMGNLTTVTNPLGHVTAFSNYDANGRPRATTDPNGVVTSLTYNFRGQITSRVTLGQTTTYSYDKVGQLTKVQEPSGAVLSYGYDAAHRLTSVSDRFGNRTVYTLDAAGNRIKEETFDPSGTSARTHKRVYDGLDRLYREIGAANQTSTFSYDANDNVVGKTDPNGNATTFAYDAMNRLTQTTEPEDAARTLRTYDSLGRLSSVTDPRNLVTRYTYNWLDLPERITSPDTRATTKTYDAAGNMLTSTDALGQTTTYAYDKLNRLTKSTYADGSIATRVYDQGAYGIGRLTSVTDSTGTTSFAYDAFGHVVQKMQTIGAVSLTTKWFYHATNGRLIGHTYPSGFKLLYSHDAAGRVSAITLQRPNGTSSTLIGAISYAPFGPVKSWDPEVSGGGSYVCSFDADGRITKISSSTGNNQNYAYDAGGRIKSISESNLAVKSFSYDRNDRLTNFVRGSTFIPYGYDATGNRTSVGGAVYTIVPSSNRVSEVAYSSGTTDRKSVV